MAILVKGTTYTSTGQVTSTSLHNLVDNATFAAGAVDDSSIALVGGKIAIKDDGVTSVKIGDDQVLPEHVDPDQLWEFTDITATKTRVAPFAVAQSTTTMTLDLANGNFQIVTISEDVDTIAALGNMATGKHFTFLLVASGAKGIATTATWDATWKWQGGVTPATTSTDGSYDIISGVTDGTNAYVTMVKNFS